MNFKYSIPIDSVNTIIWGWEKKNNKAINKATMKQWTRKNFSYF